MRAACVVPCKQLAFGRALTALGESCLLTGLTLARLLHAGFVGLATEYPPIDVPEAGGVARPTALFTERDQVAFLQGDDQLSAAATVAVFVNGHSMDCFVERRHRAKSICFGLPPTPAGFASRSSKRRI